MGAKRRPAMQERYANYASDWWTPGLWLAWVTRTFQCEIEDVFDPCPHNWRKHKPQPSGLEIVWRSPLYVNHPGSRGSAQAWWEKYQREQRAQAYGMSAIWAAFSIEQLRHMEPSPLVLPGWLVAPRQRIQWIWGGPTDGKRIHGEPMKQPTSWSVFWTNVPPATPPVESIIVRTA